MALPNPIAYWPFNEGSGPTASDASGNGHTATLVAGAWNTTTSPKFGAAALNGSGSTTRAASFADIALGTVHTIAVWTHSAGATLPNMVLGGPTTQNYGPYFHTDGNLYYTASTNQALTAAGDLSGEKHWVIVRDGATVSFYKNGTLIATLAFPAGNTLTLNSIGGTASPSAGMGAASMVDDVRLYDVALSAAQVAELYALNAPIPNPVAYWPLNEGSGTTSADASGNGRTLTIATAANWDAVKQKYGAAALKSYDARRASAFATLNLGKVHSTAFWLNNTTSAGVAIGGPLYNYAPDFEATDVYYIAGSATQVNAPHGGMTGLHHWCVTRDNTRVRFYKNGVLLAERIAGANSDLVLDSLLSYSDGQGPLLATIDDVRIYNVELTAAQVAELYAFSPDSKVLPNPIGYWPFDEGTGLTAADRSGNGRTITLDNANNWDATNQKFGAAALKNTTVNRAAYFAAGAWNIGKIHTIAFWLSNMTSTHGVVLGGADATYAPFVAGPLVPVEVASPGIYYQPALGSNAAVALGTLAAGSNHVAITRNGSSLRFYVNGALLGIRTLPVDSDMVIGSLLAYNSGSTPLTATVDDLRIYAVELSPAQIGALYAHVPITATLIQTLSPATLVSTATGGVVPVAIVAQALMQARAGIARSNATRSNYFLPNVRAIIKRSILDGAGNVIGVTDVDFTRYIVAGSLSIAYRLNDDIDQASFTLQPYADAVALNLRAGEILELALGTGVIFSGQAMQVVHRYQQAIPDPWTDVLCVDWLDLFDARLVTAEYTNLSASTILRDLLARFTPAGAFTADIAPNMPTVDTLAIVNQRLSSVFRQLTTAAGGGFYIEPSRIVRAWADGGEPYLAQPQPLRLDLKSLKAFAITEDATQIRTRVIVEGQQTTTPVEMLDGGAALESLPVVESTMFEREGLYPIRIGTQQATMRRRDTIDPGLVPVTATVSAPAVSGQTTLAVSMLDAFVVQSINTTGWCIVGNQVLRFHGWTWASTPGTGAGTLQNIPASGIGSIQAPITANAEIAPLSFLYDLAAWGDAPNPAFHAQAPGQPVVMLARESDAAAVKAWRALVPYGDGLRDQVVQDQTLSYDGAQARAAAELTHFSRPLPTAAWDTADMNAMVGRVQQTDLPVTTGAYLITEVTLSFPVRNHPPLRRCQGTTMRTASLLDVLITDQR